MTLMGYLIPRGLPPNPTGVVRDSEIGAVAFLAMLEVIGAVSAAILRALATRSAAVRLVPGNFT